MDNARIAIVTLHKLQVPKHNPTQITFIHVVHRNALTIATKAIVNVVSDVLPSERNSIRCMKYRGNDIKNRELSMRESSALRLW